MFSSYMPSQSQLKTAYTYGKIAALLGLAALVEVSMAAPQMMISCYDICGSICGQFGLWTSNNNCTGGSIHGDYAISVNTGRALNVKVTKSSVSPAAMFSIKFEGGAMCECKPANGAEFADLVFPKR